MTWAKYDTGFFAQCADAGLSDAAVRTHSEAVHWLYQCDRENVMDMSIPKKALPRFAGSDDYMEGVFQLLEVGFWAEQGETGWVLVHHAEVVRQSLTAQRVKKETDRRAAARYRDKKAKEAAKETAEANVSDDVSDDVSIGSYIHTSQTFIDVGSQEEQASEHDGWDDVTVVQPPKPARDYSHLFDIAGKARS